MWATSSINAIASALVSSRGSRRPEDDRQCTHARLQAYVSSQVRQIGADSPCSNRSRSEPSTPTDDPRAGERPQRPTVPVARRLLHQVAEGVVGARELAE